MKSASQNNSGRSTGSAGTAVWLWLVVLAMVATLMWGCALVDGTSDLKSQMGVGQMEMEFVDPSGFVRSAYPEDAVDVPSIAIENDSLVLQVRYSGGCEQHEFRLIAWNYWLESFPVQLVAALSHDDPGDACDAIVGERLAFGLRQLRQDYFESYSGAGDVIIHVDYGASDRKSVRYQFDDTRTNP